MVDEVDECTNMSGGWMGGCGQVVEYVTVAAMSHHESYCPLALDTSVEAASALAFFLRLNVVGGAALVGLDSSDRLDIGGAGRV